MSQPLINLNIDDLITEDEQGVDNFPSEKQQRLLTEPLYSSWRRPGTERNYVVAANVGVFSSIHEPAIVPDVFLSLDVELADDWWHKSHRSYFIWEFGKAPDVVIEIVSNKEGKEDNEKLRRYERMGVTYYVIFDPLRQLGGDILNVYGLQFGKYIKHTERELPGIGLGLQLWEGEFERKHASWLRWCDEQGNIIPTGKERADRLAEMLRQLGHNPDQIS